jgi:hypothetical protein
MDFRLCKTCGEHGWFDQAFGNHVCPPIWEASMVGDDDWHEVRAADAETAAEKFCQQYDSGGDYDIIRRGSAEVEVRKPGDGGEVTVWDVTAESVPEYRAWQR